MHLTTTLWRIAAIYCITSRAFILAKKDTDNCEKPSVDRKSKLFSIFSIVRFRNDLCSSTDGRNGTCYTTAECSSHSGVSSGSCAAGFGVCCVIERGCVSSTSLNCTYWKNLDSTTSNCQLTVSKCTPNVCQLRLDFISLTLAPPNTNGLCETDQFQVTGGTAPVPSICGQNSGQHMYIHTGTNAAPCRLNIATNAAFAARTFNIKITQIECCGEYNAPEGCLQWFRTATGTVMSFNFVANNQGQHLANQDYSICIRMEAGYCGVCYSQCSTTTADFALSGGVAPVTAPFNSVTDSTAMMCSMDFLLIPCASATLGPQTTCTRQKFCGGSLNTNGDATPIPIYSYKKPFIIRFMTDANEPAADVQNRGFCLNFVQQLCTAG